MFEHRVGAPYNPSVEAWPEGVHVLGLGAERAEVLIAMPDPTAAEIGAFRHAPLDVGLASHGPLVIVLARIQGLMDWSDAPFDLRRAPATERTPPGGQLAIFWVLVDSDTGIVRGLRLASVTRTFTELLRERLEAQLRIPFSLPAYQRAVAEYQGRFTTEALVRRAWITEAAGLAEPPSGPFQDVVQEVEEVHDLARLIPDERVREVVAEAVARGEAHLDERDGEWWYVDPGFGDDVPVAQLGYDDDLGMVDRRRFPERGQA